MKVHVPSEKGISAEEKLENKRDDAKEKYYNRLQESDEFQRLVVDELFNFEDYGNVMSIEAGNQEKIAMQILVKQEVIKELQERIAPIKR